MAARSRILVALLCLGLGAALALAWPAPAAAHGVHAVDDAGPVPAAAGTEADCPRHTTDGDDALAGGCCAVGCSLTAIDSHTPPATVMLVVEPSPAKPRASLHAVATSPPRRPPRQTS